MYEVVVDEARLQEIVRRLVDAFDPDKIVLFGSRARGDHHARSDLDLLIVKDTAEPVHRRTGKAYNALSGIDVPTDILWYTPQEIDDWSEVKFHVATRAMREGRVLYEKDRR